MLGELEHVVKGAMASAGEQAGAAADRMRSTLDKAQEQIDAAEAALDKNLRHGVGATDSYVKDNTWMAIGIAAAVAFVAGFSMGRRQ